MKHIKFKAFIAIAALFCSITVLSPAFAVEKSIEEEEFLRNYGELKEKVSPRPIDDKASKLAKDFSSKKDVPAPTLARNGAVVYAFGATSPRILCRPMRVTDIELEPGESVTNAPFIGDSVNWQILPATSGNGDKLTMHVMVKPTMPDLATNLVIHTDKRTYHLDLVSSKTHYTPHVAFKYPLDDTTANDGAWKNFMSNIMKDREAKKAKEDMYRLPTDQPSVPEKGHKKFVKSDEDKSKMKRLSSLDYGFTIKPKSKNVAWLPSEVYTDGAKTYIQFPQNLRNLEAPIFMAVKNGQRELVNYRVIGNTYVVDSIIDKGVLLSGTGAHAQKVIITRDKAKKDKEDNSLSKEETVSFDSDDMGKN